MSEEDLEHELDSYLAGETEDGDFPSYDEPDDYWQPPNEDGVERILRRRRLMQRRVDEIQGFVDRQVAEMRAFARDRTAGARRWIEQADRAVENFARKTHPSTVDGHAWTFPSGKFRLTAPRDSLVVDDEHTAGDFLHRADGPLEDCWSYAVAAGELKKLVEAKPYADGEYPPCACKEEETRKTILGTMTTPPTVDPSCPVHGEFEWFRAATKDGEYVPGVHLARRRRPTFNPPK